MKNPKYYVEVYEEDVRARMFKYRVELHDANRKKTTRIPISSTRVSYDWCSYRFMVKRVARKLLKTQKAKDNVRLIERFRIT